VVDWPPVIVASRVAAADVEAIRWRASETALPAVTTRVGPKTLAVALLLGALALVGCAVWLGRRLWHVPPAVEETARRAPPHALAAPRARGRRARAPARRVRARPRPPRPAHELLRERQRRHRRARPVDERRCAEVAARDASFAVALGDRGE